MGKVIEEAEVVAKAAPSQEPPATPPTKVTRRILLAAVTLAASVGILAGAAAAWAVYRTVGPAQITQLIPSNNGAHATTVGGLVAASQPSIVTVVTQPTAVKDLSKATSVSNGVVISGDGLILTSIDAVRGATQIRIGTSDGKGYDAVVVSTDPGSGLVIVRAVGAHNLKPLSLATQVPSPGDVAIAISQPATGGTTAHVTSVSAVSIQNGAATGEFEMDIPAGSSLIGAPIIDGSDHVTGVVSAPLPGHGELGSPAVPDATGYLAGNQTFVSRSFGATVALIPASTAGALTVPQGDLIIGTTSGGPADAAGLQAGDIVISVNGVPVDASHPLVPAAFNISPGQTAKLQVDRDGQMLTLSITAGS